MTDTMISMDYRHVDTLNIDQVMENDLVDIEGEIVQIISIHQISNGFVFTYQNEFGEKEIVEFDDNQQFDLYV